MKTICSVLPFILFIFLVESRERDVCILGAGASGLSTAVFLKDKGLDVAVIDIKDQVGGNCHTEYFTPDNPSQRNWYEMGVTAFINSTFMNERGYGNWGNFSSEHFVKRFINKPLLPFVPINRKLYVADFKTKYTIPTPIDPTPPAGYIEAFGRYAAQLALYPWINTGDLPDVIPLELMVPFSQFVATHQLELLVPSFFRQFVYNFRNKNILYSPTYSVIFEAGQWLYELSSNPQNGFQVDGGCLVLYKNMAKYIGKNNLYLSKDVMKVVRDKRGVKIQIKEKRGRNKKCLIFNCKKLVVSFYPGLENLKAFDLTDKEKKVFKYARTLELYPFSVNLKNTVDFFLVLNQNFTDTTFQLPTYPFVSNIVNFINANSSASTGYLLPSKVPLKVNEVKQLITQQLVNMTDLFTFKSVEKVIHHYLSPQFNKKGMEKGVIKRLRELQGKSNTYWIGGITRIDWAHTLWYQSEKFVNQYF